MKELDKKFVVSAMFLVVVVILMIDILSAVWIFASAPTLALVADRINQQIILTKAMVCGAYTSLQTAISIGTLGKNLSERRVMNHNIPFKKHHRLTSIVARIYAIQEPSLNLHKKISIQ